MSTLAELLRCPQCKSADVIKISENDLVNYQCQQCSVVFTAPRPALPATADWTRELAQAVLANCSYCFVHPDKYSGDPQEHINRAVASAADLIRSALDEHTRELREALRKYGRHSNSCPVWTTLKFPCTCGWKEVFDSGLLTEIGNSQK
jgi:hypothetical protein